MCPLNQNTELMNVMWLDCGLFQMQLSFPRLTKEGMREEEEVMQLRNAKLEQLWPKRVSHGAGNT